MTIRPARRADAEAIALLAAQLGYPAPAHEVALLLASVLPLPDHAVFVAEDEQGRIAGWLHVFIAKRLFVLPFAELGGIVVNEAHRCRGIGAALLAKAEEWALGAGCSVLRIRSNTRRVEVDSFYRDRGFDLSKTQSVFEKSLPGEKPPGQTG
jgi:GNAT superfamily N-acetyltransferase